MTTQARAAIATKEAPNKVPVKVPVKVAPKTAPEPAQFIDEYNVLDLFSNTDSKVSEPPAIIPNKDIPRNAHGDITHEATPKATPKPEAKALEELLLEDLIIEAYTTNKLVQAMIKVVNKGLPWLPAAIRSQGVKLSMADLSVRDNCLWVNK
jgi:hypothetical protein